ncbi:MAG: S1C family serine protease [Clostridia bacterium]
MKNENNKIPYDSSPIVRGGRSAPASQMPRKNEKKEYTGFKPSFLSIMLVVLMLSNLIFGVMLVNVYNREYIINQTINNNKYNISPSDNINMNNAATKALFNTVCVSAGHTNKGQNGDEYEDFFALSSRGSGIIIGDDKTAGDAYIMTNYHVIKNQTNYRVLLYGSYEPMVATLVGVSQTYDTAVLKVTNSNTYRESNAMPAEIGCSATISENDACIIVGNPKSCGISVSQGVISHVAELINTEDSGIMRLIRVDASVNPGNSGGGLFDYRGRLIGLVNAKMIEINVEGMGYAIPIDVAYSVAMNIMNNRGRLFKPVFGFDLEETRTSASINQITGKPELVADVEIRNISASSEAFNAGIINGDRLIAFSYNSVSVKVINKYSLEEHMYKMNKGDSITFEVIRKGEANHIIKTFTIKQITAIA